MLHSAVNKLNNHNMSSMIMHVINQPPKLFNQIVNTNCVHIHAY